MLRGVARGRRAAMVERAARSSAGDLAFLGTRYIAFGDPAVSPAVVDFLEHIIRSTPIGGGRRVLPGPARPRQAGRRWPPLGRVPCAVITGDRDRLIALRMGEELAAASPGPS